MTGFTFADLYDEVVSRAGGEQSTAEDVIKVRRSLRIVLEDFATEGYNTWRIREMRTTAPTGVNYLDLPDDVDDVIMITDANGSSIERVSNDQMMAWPQTTNGRPASWSLLRYDCPRLQFHPFGTAEELIIWYVERPADYNQAQDNLSDVPGRWLKAVILACAADFAAKRPPLDEALISRLEVQAGIAIDKARRADRDRSRFRYRARIRG